MRHVCALCRGLITHVDIGENDEAVSRTPRDVHTLERTIQVRLTCDMGRTNARSAREQVDAVDRTCRMSEHVYIVWVGGVDDHFDTREAANAAAQEWRW